MRSIFKYPIKISSDISLAIPCDAKILTVQMQRGTTCIWALVDPDAKEEVRRFRFIGTGHPIEQGQQRLDYVGTIQMLGGDLMYHLFELKD